MSDSSNATPDVRPITRLIHKARFLLRSSWGATGLGLTAGMALTILIALVIIDLTTPLSTVLRAVGLGLLLIPTAWVFIVGVMLPLMRRLGAIEMARRIESHIPGMHSRLVSCVDLSSQPAQNSSPAFYRRLVSESLDRIRSFKAFRVVDMPSLKRAIVFAGLAMIGFAGLYFALTERVSTAVARIVNPMGDIPPIASVGYNVTPGTTKVLKGDDITFAAKITKGEPSKLIVELYGEDEQVLVFTLDPSEDRKTFSVMRNTTNLGTGFEKNFTYRVIGGGTWSKLHSVALLERPVITSIQTAMYHPAYMVIPEPRMFGPQVTDVTGPEAGEIDVAVEASGNVAESEIQILEQRTMRTEFKNRPQRIWFEKELPKGAQPDPAWKWQPNHLSLLMTHYGFNAIPGAPSGGVESHSFANAAEPFTVDVGENLFTWVYIDPTNVPKSLMLQWQDETGWEHRAFWGEDRIPYGQPGTVGHVFMGPIPSVWSGKWTRLEVPAKLVGLEAKKLRGMAFTQFGGSAFWAEAGAGMPTYEDRTELVVVAKHPMTLVAGTENKYDGRFPLKGNGLYRVELRNELGYANKPMKEAKYESTPDKAPEILLEQPAKDLTLSKPDKVNLQVSVTDDYGLAEIWLATQREGDLRYQRVRPVKTYPTTNQVRNETLGYVMDLAEMGLKVGDTIRYRLEVRDRRPNAEATRSKDYLLRIVPDENAADKQLDRFEKMQDPFREKLVKLIADQAKIQTKIDQTAEQYRKLEDKIREMQTADAEAAPKPMPNQVKPDPLKQPLTPAQMAKLTPDEQKQLQDLRKELAALAAEEQKNTQLAQAAQTDLNAIVEQSKTLPLLSKEIVDEMKALQDAFRENANNPLADLLGKMQQQAQNAPPDTKGLDKQSDKLQRNLEALQRKMNALTEAQRQMREGNAELAKNELKNENLRQQGQMTEDELQNLKDYIQQLRAQLEKMSGQQHNLADETKNAPAEKLPEQVKKQDFLEDLLDPKLEQAKQVLKDPKTEKLKKPMFPEKPFNPDPTRERTLPPNEDDTPPEPKENDPAADPTMSKDPKKVDPKKDPMDEEKEPTFQPALNNDEKVKPDPRFDKKKRPMEKKDPKKGPLTPDEQREELQDRQNENLNELDQAQRSLEADQRALEKMLQNLKDQNQKAQNGKPMPNQQGEQPSNEMQQALEQLKQSLQSKETQNAMKMAQRAQQASQQQAKGQPQPPNQPPPPTQRPIGNLNGNLPMANTDADLSKLDIATRQMMLQLRPELREDLLQGMKAEGPEGYRKFVSDYFKRLNELQQQK